MIAFISKLNIGSKIAILPILAVVCLFVNLGVDAFLHHKISEMNSLINSTQQVAISLVKQLHDETDYLSGPNESIIAQIKENSVDVLKYVENNLINPASEKNVEKLKEIREFHTGHNDIFFQAREVVLEINRLQNELSNYFHDSDKLARKKANEITLDITYLMLEGKTLSPAKREFRISLREFIGLTSNAILNTNELLFFSDSVRYEKAEKNHELSLFQITKSCKALSKATDDPDDEATWLQIAEKQDHIKLLRTQVFKNWGKREMLSKDLNKSHKDLQNLIQQLIGQVNNETNQLKLRYNWISIFTIILILIVLVRSSVALVQNITRPVKRLAEAIDKFKEGKPNPLVKTEANDEIGILTKAFNEMMLHRQATEETLRERAEDLKESQRIANVGSWRLDLASNQVAWSDELYRMYGLDPTFPPPPYTEHQKLFTPESWEKLSTALNKTVEFGVPYELELKTVREEGAHGWMWVHGMAIHDEKGAIVGLRGVARDITDSKQVEDVQLFLAQTSSGTTGKLFFDKLARYLAQTLNMDFICIDRLEGTGLTARTVSVWCDGHFEDNVTYALKDTPCGDVVGKTVCCFPTSVCEFFPKDQVLRDLRAESYAGVTLFDHMSRPIGLIAVIGRKPLPNRPLAESILKLVAVRAAGEMERLDAEIALKESEKQKLRLEDQLQQSQKMESIGTLAGGIAHDFNNILFPIVGYTEMLLEDVPEGSPLRDSLNEIYTGSLRARDLVQQILAFSRQGKSELKLMKMQPIIKEALKLIRSTIPTTISINQNLQSDCGAVKADPTQVHQIVMNLATNAYHAMEENGGELKITLQENKLSEYELLSPDMKSGSYACLTIADSGTGMNKKTIDRIFEPFFTTKEKGKGTGMGLSVVHGIVKGMNGEIKVYSEPGKGTQFHIYLPIVKSDFEKQGPQINDPIVGGNESVFVVDDEKSIIAMEKQALERLGYQVTSRTSSIEALEAFRANPDKFDLIITDMAMPNLPGDKLATELFKIRPDIPILLCTGFSESMSEEKINSLGFKGLLLKPIIIKDLAKKIRDILD